LEGTVRVPLSRALNPPNLYTVVIKSILHLPVTGTISVAPRFQMWRYFRFWCYRKVPVLSDGLYLKFPFIIYLIQRLAIYCFWDRRPGILRGGSFGSSWWNCFGGTLQVSYIFLPLKPLHLNNVCVMFQIWKEYLLLEGFEFSDCT